MKITIQGKQGEGKSKLALDIIGDAKFITINERYLDSPFWTGVIEIDTKYIIVDDVIDLKRAQDYFRPNKIEIHRRGLAPTEIDTPNVIIIKKSL